jgi:hypothetical protein
VSALLAFLAVLIIIVVVLAWIGRRSQLLFQDPSALSDAKIERMIRITQSIMARSRPGSPGWVEAAQRNKAAVDEQLRRRGEEAFDDVEILAPDPDAR